MVERDDDRITRTSGMNTWRAGCGESRTSGSEGGPRRRAGRKAGTAPRSDPYTYVRTWAGFCYVAFVEDVFSRMIVGWSIATHLRASLATEALEMGVWRRDASVQGLIHHSDAGSQYTSVVYSERLAEHGIAPSVGSVGDSFDNAMAESAIGLYETELIRRQGPWRNPDQVEFATLEYIDWFNNRRLHGEIGHVPPAELEEVFYASRAEEEIKA